MKPRLLISLLSAGMSIAAILWLAGGCQTIKAISDGVAVVGVATGTISEEQGESIKKSGEALGSALEQLTPENEYWIGRTVAATVLGRYKPYDRAGVNRYLNQVGQSLAMFSDRPETFGGYRVLALDSDEINAFAAPGGLILVTRGMLRLCRTEDALAAVLAHEIGHVEYKHGLQAIKRSRWTGAFTTLVVEAGKSLGTADLAEAVKAFEGSIDDISQTLMNNGYSRAAERQADEAAVRILVRAGYNPNALVGMLDEMGRRLKPGGPDFAKTHPAPADRIRLIQTSAGAGSPAVPPPERASRFAAHMQGI